MFLYSRSLCSKIPLTWGLGCCLRMLPLVSMNIWWPDDEVSHFHYDSPVTECVLCSREAQQVCFPLVSFLLSSCTVYLRVHSEDKQPRIYWYCSPPVRGAGFQEETCGRKALTVPQSFTFLPLLCLPWVTDWIGQCLNSGQKSPSHCKGDHAWLAFCHITFPMSISYQLPFPKPKHLHYSTCFCHRLLRICTNTYVQTVF